MYTNKVKLISYSETVDDYGVVQRTESSKIRWCRIKSISQKEFYQAMADGMKPVCTVILPHRNEYSGEKEVELKGVRYSIEKTYEPETCDEIELTVYGKSR